MMKTTLAMAWIAFSIFSGCVWANDYDVRFNHLTCSNNQVFVDIELKASDLAGTVFILDQNYRFTFNTNAIANPAIAQELDVSGFIDGNLFSPHTLLGSVADIVSYNVNSAAGNGLPVSNRWVGIGRMMFDIVDDSECLDLHLNKTAEFPPTYIAISVGGARESGVQGEFGDVTDCFCSAPIDPPFLELFPAQGDYGFSFQSEVGISYVVQSCPDLIPADWQDLQTITGNGSLKLVVPSNAGPLRRQFYRVCAARP